MVLNNNKYNNINKQQKKWKLVYRYQKVQEGSNAKSNFVFAMPASHRPTVLLTNAFIYLVAVRGNVVEGAEKFGASEFHLIMIPQEEVSFLLHVHKAQRK